jgi:hypothetical protein
VLLVEQNAEMALGIADQAFIVERGKIVMSGNAADLARSHDVRRAYLGMSAVRRSRGSHRQRPLLKAGDVQDVAEAVVYLTAPSGKDITGETIHLHGGMVLGRILDAGMPDDFEPPAQQGLGDLGAAKPHDGFRISQPARRRRARPRHRPGRRAGLDRHPSAALARAPHRRPNAAHAARQGASH